MPSLSFRLDGSVALVTGGTSGIGLAIAEALLDAGAKVVVGSRGEEKVRSAEQHLKANRPEGSVLALILDVADQAQIASAVEAAVSTFGRLDILVNCAGANVKRPSLEVTEEEHRRIFDINYFGPFAASQLFARQVIKQGPAPAGSGGYSIVNVCSVTSYLAMVESTAYASSKSALLGMTRQLAVEWPRLYGIRVNGIAPGFVPADQNRKILQQGSRGRRVIEHTPMERFGVPEEIAGSVVFLVSQAGRFMNGECINIDGGFISTAVCEAEFHPEALDALAEASKQ